MSRRSPPPPPDPAPSAPGAHRAEPGWSLQARLRRRLVGALAGLWLVAALASLVAQQLELHEVLDDALEDGAGSGGGGGERRLMPPRQVPGRRTRSGSRVRAACGSVRGRACGAGG